MGALPRTRSGLSPARRRGGLLLAAAGLPTLTAGLVMMRATLALESVLLLYLLLVVAVALIGGILPALLAAVGSFLLANWFLTPPYHTFVVEQRDQLIALAVFIVVATTVSVTVELAARQRVTAERSRIEAEVLAKLTGAPVSDTSLADVLEQVRTIFGMTSVALLERHGDNEQPVEIVGPPLHGAPAVRVDAGPGLRLVAEGPQLFGEDRRLLARLAAAATRAWENQKLADEATQGRQLAEIDRLRSGLLAAVGHDLRTPLAGIKAAVSSLRQEDLHWTPEEEQELLVTIEASADRLEDLIANLLAMSRLQAGALSVHKQPVALGEVVPRALIGIPDHSVNVTVADDLPLVEADPGLLERVVANLVANARRFAPEGQPVLVQADADEHVVRLQVSDRGPGVPREEWTRIFQPFQRLGDRPTDGAGVGLGLAIARGFTEAMGGTLTPADTPGGGLTMTVTLPVAP
jgi:two-component system, OmpR family, sensor histidine kinase KdpD